ncbi:hypothetical protein [Simiduia litorea]|uniref:hypothetical protein n=1 Tax=Simiduia litorea TaxID=1435348 RepID=UPI0036F29248
MEKPQVQNSDKRKTEKDLPPSKLAHNQKSGHQPQQSDSQKGGKRQTEKRNA